VRQELDKAQAFLIELAGLDKNGAAPPEQLGIEQGEAEAGRPKQHNDALRIASGFESAFLDSLKKSRQGHGICGL